MGSRSFTNANGTGQARVDLLYNGDGMVSTVTRYADLAGTQVVGKSNYSYDSNQNLTGITHTNASGTVLASFAYSYNLANQISSKVENGVTTTYGYDAASQLINVNGQVINYDSNGNQTGSGVTITSDNRLGSDGTWNYTYDNLGNTLSKTNIATGEYWSYTWNDANRLTNASDFNKDGTLIQSISFKYNVFDQLYEEKDYVASSNTTTTTRYAYDLSGNVYADLNGSNQITARHLFININGQEQPFAKINASGNVSWYLTDNVGSVRNIINNAGTVQDTISYNAFGAISSESNPGSSDRYKFQSGWYNSALNMTLFDHRWLMSLGRWFSQDPLGLSPDSNPYRFVGNNAISGIDPRGEQEKVIRKAPIQKQFNTKKRMRVWIVFSSDSIIESADRYRRMTAKISDLNPISPKDLIITATDLNDALAQLKEKVDAPIQFLEIVGHGAMPSTDREDKKDKKKVKSKVKFGKEYGPNERIIDKQNNEFYPCWIAKSGKKGKGKYGSNGKGTGEDIKTIYPVEGEKISLEKYYSAPEKDLTDQIIALREIATYTIGKDCEVRLKLCYQATGYQGKRFLESLSYWLNAKVVGNDGQIGVVGWGKWYECCA